MNYDKATYTHCEVPELLPSISAVIGGFEVQRFVWTFSVAFTTGPRLVFCKLQQANLREKFNSKTTWIKWNLYLNYAEILSLLTLSLVTSEEIFIVHALAFSTFCLTSIFSMILVTFVIRDNRNARFKKTLLKLSVLCVFGAVFSYLRHNEYCEPYVYTMFAVCEYTVVAVNMVWHANIVNQFSGYNLVAEPCLEMK